MVSSDWFWKVIFDSRPPIFRFETITCKKGGINSWHRDYRKWWSKFTINNTECPIHMLSKYCIHIDLTVFSIILMLSRNRTPKIHLHLINSLRKMYNNILKLFYHSTIYNFWPKVRPNTFSYAAIWDLEVHITFDILIILPRIFVIESSVSMMIILSKCAMLDTDMIFRHSGY